MACELVGAALVAQIAPELANDPRVGIFLTIAARMMGACAWGDLYSTGQAYLAAHLLTRAGGVNAAGGAATGSGIAGAVSSMTDGDQSISFGNTGNAAARAAQDAEFLTTSYGSIYLSLRDLLPSNAPFSTWSGC